MKEISYELLNKIIFGKFQIIKKEGKGVFSTVFSGKNINNQMRVAMKIQEKSELFGELEKEAYFLFQLKGLGIPKIISYGHYGRYNILILELLGKSLEYLFKENKDKPKIVRLKDMAMAGIQIIDRLKFIHSNFVIHLDIKPNNFLVGNPDNSLIYIIDFGLAKKYRSSRTGRHVKYTKNSYFSGNMKYSSVNTMKGIEPSRRDDLESLGYMLIYLYNQKLPWEALVSNNRNEIGQKVYEMKKHIPIKLLCKDLPNEMEDFIYYVKSLKFEQEPNYDYLTKILENILKKVNKINDMQFSWVKGSINKEINNIRKYKIIKKRDSPFSKIINRNKKINKINELKCFSQKIQEINDKNKINTKINPLLLKKYTNSYKCILEKNIRINNNFNIRKIININKKIIPPSFSTINIHNKNGKTQISEDCLKYNQSERTIKQHNKRNRIKNYKFIFSPIISNKTINIYSNNIKNLSVNFNQTNIPKETLKKNKTFKCLNNYNVGKDQKDYLIHSKTRNYFSPIKSNYIINFNEEQSFKIDNNKIKNYKEYIILNSNTVYKRKFNSNITE